MESVYINFIIFILDIFFSISLYSNPHCHFPILESVSKRRKTFVKKLGKGDFNSNKRHFINIIIVNNIITIFICRLRINKVEYF